MVTCLICRREWPEVECHIVVPTSRDKDDLRAEGVEPLDQYPYCDPCWRAISDPVTGPALMRGIFEGALLQFGVLGADKIASKYHDWLIRNARKPRS